MNSDDLMKSISNIDPEIIKDAAWELDDTAVRNIISKRKKAERKRILFTVIPIAACALLMMGVTGILMSQNMFSSNDAAASPKSFAATTAEAPCSEAADAEATAAETSFDDTAYEKTEPSAYEEVCEESGETFDEAVSEENEEVSNESKVEERGTAFAYSVSAQSESNEKAEKVPSVLEAVFEEGVLTITVRNNSKESWEFDGEYILYQKENEEYIPIEEINSSGKNSVAVKAGPDSENCLVVDLKEFELKKGEYRMEIGDLSVEFVGE